jgi:hypothetical protein
MLILGERVSPFQGGGVAPVTASIFAMEAARRDVRSRFDRPQACARLPTASAVSSIRWPHPPSSRACSILPTSSPTRRRRDS